MWQSAEKELPSSLLLAFGVCNEYTFPDIHRLLLIACPLPISSAEAERSFSLMKRIKTFTRLTMSEEYEERSLDLAVIAMHYPGRFEVDEICEAFVKAHPRRLFQLHCLTNEVCNWKRQITFAETAPPFNHTLLFLVFWLRNKINSRCYIMPSKRFSSLRNAANDVLEGKIRFFLEEGASPRTLESSLQRDGVPLTLNFN